MTTPPVPLSLLVTKDVPYEWHDAVALIAQLVGQVRSDIPFAQGRVPDLRGIELEPDGTLTVTLLPGHSMPGMPGAAQLLQQLLSGKEQPAPLRLFAMQAATAEPAPTLDAFADELAKWERPNRAAKLAAVYRRAFDVIGPSALTDDTRARDVREATVKRSADPGTVGSRIAPPQKGGLRQPLTQQAKVVLAASFAVVLVAAGWIASGRSIHFGRTSAPVKEIEAIDAPDEPMITQGPVRNDDVSLPAEAAAPVAAARAPRPRRQPAASEPTPSPAVARAEAELARARALFAQREYSAASAHIEDVLRMLGSENSPQAQELRQIASSLAEVARAAVVQEAVTANREFRDGDQGVSPPVPLAHLPRPADPSTPPERLQVLELHINTDGTVDSAKFVMNRPTFRNAWWTSAAKAWHFEPAMKDGRPVRYVMRLVLDDFGSP